MSLENSLVKSLKVGPRQDGDNKRFGDMLRGWRKSAGLPVNKVAELLSVSASYIRLIEHGERVPAQDTARQLLTLLTVAHSETLPNDESPFLSRCDLLIQDPDRPDQMYAVDFVSRVATRRTEDRSVVEERLAEWLNAHRSLPAVGDYVTPVQRDAMLGRIIQLLPDVSWESLQRVEGMLNEDAGRLQHRTEGHGQ